MPLLWNLAFLWELRGGGSRNIRQIKPGIIEKKINRHYLRLCRVQEELGKLDLKKSKTASLEDYVFSQLDFTPYKEIPELEFENILMESIQDFNEAFFQRNFNLNKNDAHILIKKFYVKEDSLYIMQGENPLVISLIHSLYTSLEDSGLFSMEDIENELNIFSSISKERDPEVPLLPDTESIFYQLINSLGGLNITHNDGMKTKLFIKSREDGSIENLSATFMPNNKAWTRVLIHCSV